MTFNDCFAFYHFSRVNLCAVNWSAVIWWVPPRQALPTLKVSNTGYFPVNKFVLEWLYLFYLGSMLTSEAIYSVIHLFCSLFLEKLLL